MPASELPVARPRLPILPSAGWKYFAGLVVALLSAALYLLPNRMMAASATPLPLHAIDLAVPFMPWTGWIYASVYVYLLIAFVSLTDLETATRFLYACLFAQVVAAAFFVFTPTVYPRELWPVPPAAHDVHGAVAAFWRAMDAPANCFPSLHVSTSVLSLAALAGGPLRRHRTVAIAAALLLAASTLTFKQHYFADVVGGAVLGAAGWALFLRKPGLFRVGSR